MPKITLAKTLAAVMAGQDGPKRLWVPLVAHKGAEGTLQAVKEFATTLGVVAALMATISIASLAEPPSPMEGRVDAEDFDVDNVWVRAFVLASGLSFVFNTIQTLWTVFLFTYADHVPPTDDAVGAWIDANAKRLAGFSQPLLWGVACLLIAEGLRMFITYGGDIIVVIVVVVGLLAIGTLVPLFISLDGQVHVLKYAHEKARGAVPDLNTPHIPGVLLNGLTVEAVEFNPPEGARERDVEMG